MLAVPPSRGEWVAQEAWPVEALGAGSELWDEAVLTVTLYAFALEPEAGDAAR